MKFYTIIIFFMLAFICHGENQNKLIKESKEEIDYAKCVFQSYLIDAKILLCDDELKKCTLLYMKWINEYKKIFIDFKTINDDNILENQKTWGEIINIWIKIGNNLTSTWNNQCSKCNKRYKKINFTVTRDFLLGKKSLLQTKKTREISKKKIPIYYRKTEDTKEIVDPSTKYRIKKIIKEESDVKNRVVDKIFVIYKERKKKKYIKKVKKSDPKIIFRNNFNQIVCYKVFGYQTTEEVTPCKIRSYTNALNKGEKYYYLVSINNKTLEEKKSLIVNRYKIPPTMFKYVDKNNEYRIVVITESDINKLSYTPSYILSEKKYKEHLYKSQIITAFRVKIK